MSGSIYSTARWKRLRLAHLSRFPLCMDCRQRSMIEMATVVDHVVPISAGGPAYPGHDGLRSLCVPCHSRKTARGVEAGAVRTTRERKGCDADGNSFDTSHPWNGGDGALSREAIDRRMPLGLRPSRIPLVIVTGPPGAGKSTYVREHAGSHDLVICLDTIMQEITRLPEHHRAAWATARALETRNRLLSGLADDQDHHRAWFIVAAPKPSERRSWSARLGGELIVLDTQLPECVRRIKADAARVGLHDRMIEAATKWWEANPHLVRKSLRADA